MKVSELFDVSGYGVIVTGGASGIGLGYVEALAENGARVTLLDRDAGRVSEVSGRLQAAGLDVQGRVVDVTDHPALDAAFDESAARYGRLDVVFANAGIDSGPGFLGSWFGTDRGRPAEGALENYTDERWNRTIEINLNGVFATVRAAARHMKPRRSGRIIVTTSVAAIRVEPAVGAAYMAAKAACHHLVHNVAMELAMHNITVNAIAPGLFVTNIGGGHLKNPELQKVFAQAVPMQRVGFPDDIHGLALFLASPASGYVTGQQIAIDGGYVLGSAD
jgi:NAD(P)-dependent dehydrogenase (short-subunit alcohol dehydrogenase family)